MSSHCSLLLPLFFLLVLFLSFELLHIIVSVGRESPIARAVLLYQMRPNIPSKRQIEDDLQTILPTSLNSQFTIGMPLRGSDKCYKESNCLTFDEYMQVAVEAWEELKATMSRTSTEAIPTRGTLILTTEDKRLFSQRLKYTTNNGTHYFPLDFVVNENDIMQSSGNVGKVTTPRIQQGESSSAADRIILSSLIAIQMQFYAKFVYGNCCSSFHFLIFSFLQLGCGSYQEFETNNRPRCYPNVCCKWTSKSECEAIRTEYNQTLFNRAARKGKHSFESVTE